MKQNTVFSQSSGRNHRPKESKFNRVLQVALLLAASIWLLYQIKHPHDQPKRYGGNAQSKMSREYASILMGRKGNVRLFVGAVVDSDGIGSVDVVGREDGSRVDSDFDRNIEEKGGKAEEESQSNRSENSWVRSIVSHGNKEHEMEPQIYVKEGKEEDEKVSSNRKEEDDSHRGEEKTELTSEVADQETSAFIIMAPHGEAIVTSHTRCNNFNKPSRLSNDSLQRTISDLSLELSKDTIDTTLPPISEVEDARCECCGMSEECTPEYVKRVRDKFSGKWICGLCSEAVKGEVEKNGGQKEEALISHMSACVSFNKHARAYPVLYQAEAMREMLRKSSRLEGRGVRANSISPRDKGGLKKGGIARSTSCIAAITKEMNGLTITN
ncbi:hypothetical protein F0562_024716 [Nyssa sinensis]|uniref:DUF1677 domain-containing protein n=1 Tax=Nyssa sinensis TaxID=561372 RepID=A0A5J5BB04_9ASTE|nr:hypothetical protein F0562_024716 [Nyssa sinensis]